MNTTKIVEQLRSLLQLTTTEIQIIQARIPQARTEAVQKELIQNGKKAQERLLLIADALEEMGSGPGIVTPAVGRLVGAFKLGLEQAEPVREALLQDLSLEHQLLDRARYLKTLAETSGEESVKRLAERLITAHTSTVEWITEMLKREASGEPAVLQASLIQKAAGAASRIVQLPAQYTAEGVNKTASVLQQGAEGVWHRFGELTNKASKLTGAVKETAEAGQSASLQRAELLAQENEKDGIAESIHEVRADLGVLQANELPIKKYDDLNLQEASAAIKKLDTVQDVESVLAYEGNHRSRAGIMAAGRKQIEKLEREAVAV